MTDNEISVRTLTLTRGLPASGKSSYAKKYVAESPSTRTRVNRDNIRFSYYGAYWGDDVDELGVSKIELGIAETIMAKGTRGLIADATHVKSHAVIPYLLLAEQYGYSVVFVDFNEDVEELVRRDARRERQVGEDVIRDFASKYYEKGKLRPPPKLVIDGVEVSNYTVIDGAAPKRPKPHPPKTQ